MPQTTADTHRAAPSEPPPVRDELFNQPGRRVDDFAFNREVTAVFDDMIDRSVPFYQEIQRMTAELAADYVRPGTDVYDLGCSTGNTLLQLNAALPADCDVGLVGIDESPEMLDKCQAKLRAAGVGRRCALRRGNLNEGPAIENASVVLLVLTLQFVRPLYRDRLIKSIYDGLGDHGCLLIVEKVLGESSTFNRLFIKHYYEMKMRNGYSELEIAQKREALENVLVPYRLEENREMLRNAGFKQVDVFFKWYNFCGIIAQK